ncbi:MAG: histidine ammonia-lyase, partial [Phycisphaerae bacterium]|nr:histidine ammonia-lyase [Phycisphaerae bacterium]
MNRDRRRGEQRAENHALHAERHERVTVEAGVADRAASQRRDSDSDAEREESHDRIEQPRHDHRDDRGGHDRRDERQRRRRRRRRVEHAGSRHAAGRREPRNREPSRGARREQTADEQNPAQHDRRHAAWSTPARRRGQASAATLRASRAGEASLPSRPVSSTPERIELDGAPLPLEALARIAAGAAVPALGEAAKRRMLASRAVVERAAAGDEAVYGINTGFGSLAKVRIGRDDLRSLQRNLVRSHASGVGERLPAATVRAMMAVLAASLARGLSGVRPIVVEQLCRMLEADALPCVPSRGSVGASGDLAPLAHVALGMMGEGDAELVGMRTRAGHALKARGIAPLELEAKEGLALINGTHAMSAIGGLALLDAERIFRAAVRSAALAMEASLASDSYLDERLHAARGQPGPSEVAALLRRELEGSKIIPSHRENDPRVQDPYSLRCSPQVLGAALDALRFVRGVVERELGAVTDNPLVFADGERGGRSVGAGAHAFERSVVSGGNFHGMPLAIAFDAAKIAIVPVAGIAERRVSWVLGGADPFTRLTPHLAHDPGLKSGLMIAQYAAAACCNELQTLCVPACVANIPTCAGMEDYNSFGATSALQFERAVTLARSVVAIELLCMTEALERHRPLTSGARVEATAALVRSVVPASTDDRPPAPLIAAIESLIAGGAF